MSYPSGTRTPTLSGDLVSLLKERFARNFKMERQQKDSKFLPLTVKEEYQGKYTLLDFYESFKDADSNELTAVTQRFQATSWVYPKAYQRRLTCDEWTHAVPIEPKDAVRIMSDPKDKIMTNALAAYRRKVDDVIIAALDADVTKVVTAAATGATTESTISLPSNQILTSDTKGVHEGLILDARTLLADNYVNFDEEQVYVAISPKQFRQLLDKDRLVNNLYMQQQALATGKLPSFIGFTFMESTRLKLVKKNDKYYRRCPIWCPTAISYTGEEDPAWDFGPRRDYGFTMQLQSRMEMGAARNEESGVVVVDCYVEANTLTDTQKAAAEAA